MLTSLTRIMRARYRSNPLIGCTRPDHNSAPGHRNLLVRLFVDDNTCTNIKIAIAFIKQKFIFPHK